MKKNLLALIIAFTLTIGLLNGCSSSNTNTSTEIIESTEKNNSITATTEEVTPKTSFINASEDTTTTEAKSLANLTTITKNIKTSDTDSAWDITTSTQIKLNDTTATITGNGATASGSTVTINAAGTYVLSGKLSKGQIIVNAGEKDDVRLVLNGVEIIADKNAAIYSKVADKLVIILADGTTNKITDGNSYTYDDVAKEEPNASIFSKSDLSINGTGALIVNGNFNHGIATKDDLVIVSGNITVNSVGAAIRGKDSVTILDGTFNLTSKTGDAIKAAEDTDVTKGWVLIDGGTFDINAYNDGIQAYTTLEINGGNFNIVSGNGFPGGSLKKGSHAINNDGVVTGTNPIEGSYKGLKSTGDIIINDGKFVVSSYNDAIHANGNITINSGVLELQSGSKGIHADNIITISGGQTDIKNSYEGIEASSINLNAGKVNIYSTDDGINLNNSTGTVAISEANVYINAGGDGMDSNNNVVMTGGTLYIDGPTSSGDSAIDYQNQFTISGGVLISTDMGNMSQAPTTSSEQTSIMLYYTSIQKAGTKITLKSSDGTVITEYIPNKDFKSIIISSKEIKMNETYTFYTNDAKLCDVAVLTNLTTIDDTGVAVTGRMGGGGPGGAKGGNRGSKIGN